ncbi:response regulator transcription factor [Cupriavidus basilensis]|uniref:response regulator transcription factor n=1 Tax=Cupriavidus basilensis TaxID=68895 RepID=UPI001F505C9B|nr:response regulator transcription factor [Cupriavidus basilensis]
MSTESFLPFASPIRVALIEDDPRFSAAFLEALSSAPDMRTAGVATTLQNGLALLQSTPPADILVVDLGLPDGSGIDAIRAARVAWPRCDVMVATVFGDESHVMQSIAAGATGYLLKDSSAAHIVRELRSLHQGGSPISPVIARQVLSRLQTPPADMPVQAPQAPAGPKPSALSPREYEVLNEITRGFSHDEIAQRIGVSRHTLLTFVRRIYVKLDVHSKVEAINVARQHGLLRDD